MPFLCRKYKGERKKKSTAFFFDLKISLRMQALFNIGKLYEVELRYAPNKGILFLLPPLEKGGKPIGQNPQTKLALSALQGKRTYLFPLSESLWG